MSLIGVLRRDEKCAKLLRDVRSGVYSLDFEALFDEIERMHMQRAIRRVTVSEILAQAQKNLIEAVLQNQAYRSRCVEIQMQCQRKQGKLDKRFGILRNYLLLTYATELGTLRTQAERHNVVDSALSAASSQSSDLNALSEFASLMIADLDQAGWAFQRMVAVLEMSTRPQRNV
jgi:hypothetical protein